MTTILYSQGTVAVDRTFFREVNEAAFGPKMFMVKLGRLDAVYTFCGSAASMAAYLDWLRGFRNLKSADSVFRVPTDLIAKFPIDYVTDLQCLRVVHCKTSKKPLRVSISQDSPYFFDLDIDQTIALGSGGSGAKHKFEKLCLERDKVTEESRPSIADLIARAVSEDQHNLQIFTHLPFHAAYETCKPVEL